MTAMLLWQVVSARPGRGKCKGSDCEMTGPFVKAVVDPTSDAELGIYDEQSAVKFVRLVE